MTEASGTARAQDVIGSERLFELLRTLTELPGPVGQEEVVQDWIASRWATFAPEVRLSKVNNVFARVGGAGQRLVFMAHADEICLMVKSIADSGHLHVWPFYNDRLGKPPRWFNPANQPCLVLTDDDMIPGYIATASGHVVGGQSSKKEGLEWNDLFVEVGAESRADVEAMGVRPGCRVIWNPPTRRLGSHRITGKAMDDRAALLIATLAGELLADRGDLAYEVWLASTVQEENGLIGAGSVVDELGAEFCLNLDVGLTGDVPGPDARDFPAKLGAGPMIVHQDSSAHYTRSLIHNLDVLAKERHVPLQHAIFQNYGSDGAELIRRGAATALLAYPTRYTHSPIETVDERDLFAAIDLLVAFATVEPGPVS